MDGFVAAVDHLVYAGFEVRGDVQLTQQTEQLARGCLLQARELLPSRVFSISLLSELENQKEEHCLQQVRAPNEATDRAQQRIDALVLPHLEPGRDSFQVIEGQWHDEEVAVASFDHSS
jgi:hypothetical protein